MPAGRPKEKVRDKVNFHQVALLAQKGWTDAELAEFFQVTRRTIDNWKKDEEFLTLLKEKKQVADEQVVRSLYERATGYNCEDTYFSSYRGEIISETYIKHYPPDVTACIFWLKNRQPDKWRDKISEAGETGDSPIEVED